MASVSDIIDTQRLKGIPEWRIYLSAFCVLFGAVGVIFGVLGASTNILMMMFGWSVEQSWQTAGVFGGAGAFLLLASIPYATPRVSDTSLTMIEVGALFTGLAIAIFMYQYPENWNIFQWETIALVSIVYLIGIGFSLGSALKAVIGFKVRQSPGGKVRMIVEGEDGEIEEIEVAESTLRDDPHYAIKSAVEDMGSVGGIGLIGGRPDEFYETQTNRPDKKHPGDD